MKKLFVWFGLVTWSFSAQYYYMCGGKRVWLEKISEEIPSHRSIGSVVYFMGADGERVGVSKRIIVKFDSLMNLEAYMKKYSLRLVRKYDFGNMFVFECDSVLNALETANRLYEKPDVVYAQPDLIREWKLR